MRMKRPLALLLASAALAGMLTFIPLCSVAYTLLKRSTNDRLRKKRIPLGKYLD